MTAPSEVATISHFDRGDKSVTFCRVQDVEDILESNKALQGIEQSRKSDFRHTHRLPTIFIEKILFDQWKRGNVNLKWSDRDFWKIIDRELLHNSEYRDFRVDNPSNPFYLGWRNAQT